MGLMKVVVKQWTSWKKRKKINLKTNGFKLLLFNGMLLIYEKT